MGEGATLIAGAVGTLVEQNRQFRNADEERKAADTKTPDTFLGTAVQTLLRVAQVATAADLPQMWHDLAAATKKAHQRNIIQMAMDEALNRVAPGGGWPYIITPSLAEKVVGLQFRMSNPDNLSTGIQPFILVQTSASDRQAAETLVHMYDTVMGGTSATVTDAQALVSNDMAILPRTFLHARAALQVFQAVLHMTLGEDHAWTLSIQRFILRFSARELELEQLQTRDPQYRNLVPALLVRWVQLRWNDWLQTQWYCMVDNPVPDLQTLFSEIRLGTAWEPTIPLQYLRLPAVAAGGDDASRGGTHQQTRQLLSPVRPAGAAGGGATGLAPNAIVRNTAYAEADFAGYRDTPGVIIRDLLDRNTANPPPISSSDSPANRGRFPNTPLRVCLSYHVKGMCNSRCGRAADHGPLAPEKHQEISAWCAAHWARTAAPGTT